MSVAGKYEAGWESLKQYKEPEWFKDAKFGIFVHWGAYAVPAFGNEWYPLHMYTRDSDVYKHHREKWGPQKEFGYKDFIPMFKGEKWDPKVWVDLFKKAGARYVVPVAEHHDGFPMYDCSFTNWNAARMGPCRDVCRELAEAVRAGGMHFGVSSHRARHWYHYRFDDDFDTSRGEHSKLYGVPHAADAPVSREFILDWYERTKELVDLFSPDILYFDFGWHRDEFGPWLPRVVAYYYNHAAEHGYEPVLNYKAKVPEGVAIFDVERGKADKIREHYWQTDTSISYKSWGYIEDDDFRSAASVVHDLVDIVSKNGNLLMNVGPMADGTIPEGAIGPLVETGEWLKVNGEAIYGTRHWKTYGEGPTGQAKAFKERTQAAYTAEDIRFTTKGDHLYAICLGWPGEKCLVKTLRTGGPLAADEIGEVAMLGGDQKLSWSQDDKGLTINTPKKKPCDHAYAFKIAMK